MVHVVKCCLLILLLLPAGASSFVLVDRLVPSLAKHVTSKHVTSPKRYGIGIGRSTDTSETSYRSQTGIATSTATTATSSIDSTNKLPSLKPYIEKLISKSSLSSDEAEQAFSQILQGADPTQVGSLLMMLRMKGETSQEIAGMVRAMNRACNKVTIGGKLLDIVGTGGDGADTINISTLSAVVAAASGCVVAKAGNR